MFAEIINPNAQSIISAMTLKAELGVSLLRRKPFESILALLFATLVAGTIVLLLTGKDIVLRFGFVSAASVAITWIVWFTVNTIKRYLQEKRYLEVATTVGLQGGIVLLSVYLFWFFLSEFFQV